MEVTAVFLTWVLLTLANVECIPQLPQSQDFDVKQYINRSLTPDEIRKVEKEDVKFKLWTGTNQSIVILEGQLKDVEIIKDAPIKVLVHGFQSSGGATWVREITEAYIRKGRYNVIQVDWRKLSNNIYYPTAAGSTEGVGQVIADLLIDLKKTLYVPVASMHLIGHSLGAHVSGFAGKHVQELTSEKIGRISGLDPAGPLFIKAKPNERLDKKDAMIVDIIHTDGKSYGMLESIGSIDFFPNGGIASQPGCIFYFGDLFFALYDQCVLGLDGSQDPNALKKVLNQVLCGLCSAYSVIKGFQNADSFSKGAKKLVTCSHSRSHELWLEGINSNTFIATECDSAEDYNLGLCNNRSTAIMGEMTTEKLMKGNFYLNTNAEHPYARNGLI